MVKPGFNPVAGYTHAPVYTTHIRFTPGTNPANWMLEVTAPGAENALGVDFAQIYAGCELAAANKALVEQACGGLEPPQQHEASSSSSSSSSSSLDRPFAASNFKQFR